jgi:hypothetical protein
VVIEIRPRRQKKGAGRLRVRVGLGGWSPLMRDAHEWGTRHLAVGGYDRIGQGAKGQALPRAITPQGAVPPASSGASRRTLPSN